MKVKKQFYFYLNLKQKLTKNVLLMSKFSCFFLLVEVCFYVTKHINRTRKHTFMIDR